MSQSLLNSTTSCLPAPRAADRLRRAANVTVVVLFLSALALPLIAQLSGLSQAASVQTEKRQAAALPQLELRWRGPLPWPRKRSLLAFPTRFEAYYNDHFGFRRQLVQSYNLARLAGCTPSVLASPVAGQSTGTPVVVGREGWLYYLGDHDIETYRCAKPFSQQELDLWLDVYRQRRNWLARHGVEYFMVLPPTKTTIYPEFLPRSVNRVGTESRLDQLIAHFREHGGPEIIDLRATLCEGKRQYPTYYCTDTHWNPFGAFLGYRELARHLQRRFPAIEPRALADYEVTSDGVIEPDLARMLDSPLDLPERFLQLRPLRPLEARFRDFESDSRLRHALSVKAAAPPLKAVVTHDSYMLGMRAHLSEHFQQVHYLWTYDFPLSVIASEQPHVVIEEMVERYLYSYRPVNSPELEFDGPRHELADRTDRPQMR